MRRRDKRKAEPELQKATVETEESVRQADADLEKAIRDSVESLALAERLRALNASNGFAEMLFNAVIRGAR